MSRCAALLMLSLLAGAEPRPDRHGEPLPEGALARLGTIRQRVAASNIALSADGRTIVTDNGGRMVGRWDAATGRLREFRRLPGLPGAQSWLAPDGRLLAVGDGEGSLNIFDTETGVRKCLLITPGWPASFAPDGKTLVTGENDGKMIGSRVRLWNLATSEGRLLIELAQSIESLDDCAFSPDGKRLFTAFNNHSLRCWDVESGKEIWKNDHWANHLAVSPDGRILCTNTYQQPDLHLWDAGTGGHLGKISMGRGRWDRWVGRVAFAPDGRTGFASVYRDILLWDTATRTVRHRLAGAGSCYAVAPDSKTLVSLAGSQLRRWDVETGKPLYPDTAGDGHTGAVCGLVFTPDGQGVVTIGADETIRLWELATQRPRTLFTGVRPRYGGGSASARSPDSWQTTFYPLQNLAVTPDGRRLLSGIGNGELRLTNIPTGEEVRRFEVRNASNRLTLGTSRLSADGRTLWTLPYHEVDITGGSMTVARQETMVGWDVATGRRVSSQVVAWCGDSVDHIISPDGRFVALEYGGLRDVASGEDPLKDARELSNPFAFSPDSRLVAAADLQSQDRWNRIAVHEMLTGRRLMRLEAPISWSSRFAFSPDGRLLIASGADALHVWEISSGRRLLHLPAEGRLRAWLPGSFATCLAMAPDGRTAATGHEDGTVLLWDLAPLWRRLAERPTVPLTTEQVVTCWSDLLQDDPRTAYAAMDRLTAAPLLALPMLRKHLRPVTVDSQWLADRLAALDSADFAVRDKASRDLEAIVEAIEPRLREELKRTASLEVRSRLRRLLEVPHPLVPDAEKVRSLRGVAVLERLATAEARVLLRELAKGEPAARLTEAANDALARLGVVAAARSKP